MGEGHFFALVGAAVGFAQDQRGVDVAGHAAEVGQEVVDEGEGVERGDGVGLGAALSGVMAGGVHAFDREAEGPQVAEAGFFVFEIEG